MPNLTQNPGETIIAQAKAQYARGAPQTAGALFLTNQRLVLEPDQLASMFMGKRWEAPLSLVTSVKKLGNFEGGSLIGSAGKKLAITLDDTSQHTFSFYLSSNIDAFYDAFMAQLAKLKS